MVAAARGEPHDPRWDCDARAFEDLRATRSETRDAFAKKAIGEPVLYGVHRLELASPALGNEATLLSLRGDLAFWPDGRVRWGDVSSGEIDDPDQLLPIGQLDPEIAGPLKEFTRRLPTPACSLATPTLADFDGLPLSAKDRAEAAEQLPRFVEQAREACEHLRGATGPWRARARG